jgi:hypothetical protein
MGVKILASILIFIFVFTGFVFIQPSLGQSPSVGQMVMELNSTPMTNHHPGTDVDVTKSVSTAGSGMVFEYDIKTPPVNDFNFVLALDSSGSLAESNLAEQLEAVNIAVPNFINRTLVKYHNRKNFNLSIISWNHKVDFAYTRSDLAPPEVSGFNNTDPSRAIPGPIDMVFRDLNKGNPIVFHWPVADKGIFKSLPIAHTDLSVALKASMDILNNSAKYDTIYRRPVKFIILVTGESEYSPCDPSLIAAAKGKGYSVYAIQMNPQPNSLGDPDSMFRHLTNITRDVNKVIPTPPVQGAIAPTSDLPSQLENALGQALQLAITEPVATNVVIQDSFYNYIVPTDEASIKIMRLDDSERGFTGQYNNGTLTLPFPYGLPENNTTKVITYCNFVLRDLPISANNGSASVVLASRGKDTASVIHYTWLKTLDREADLPAISMDLTSNVQLAVKGSPSTPPAATTKSPGLLSGLLTIISSLANSDIQK